MKKIPTMFVRDWSGDKSRVLPEVTPGCEWVLAGEGMATRKLDGTSCRYADGRWWRRRELRKGDAEPTGFVLADHDEETGKTVGWMPVGDGPEDRYHREAASGVADPVEGATYELIGPKVQGNPECADNHLMVEHGRGLAGPFGALGIPRTFDGLKTWLAEHNVEGVVFHHSDGRMAKIKARDFGIKRSK